MSIPYTKFVLIVPLKKVGQFSISISSIRRTQSFTSRLTVLILDASFQAQAKNKQFVQLHSRRQPLPMAGTLLCNASSASAFLARTSSSKTSLSLPLKPLALRSFSPSSRTGFFSKPFHSPIQHFSFLNLLPTISFSRLYHSNFCFTFRDLCVN